MGALSVGDASTEHRRYPIRAEEDVGVVRRAVRAAAAQLPVLAEGMAELVATELATNIQRHTPGGYLLVRVAGDGIELVAVDHGRGLPAAALEQLAAAKPGLIAGPARAGGLGAGLAAVRRGAAGFDYYSAADGTVILARLGAAPASTSGHWRWGGINVPLGGDGASGDAWAVIAGPRMAAFMVDGIGHGPEAAAAAQAAIAEFNRQPLTDPGGPDPATSLAHFMAGAHRAMRATRGGVLGICVLDPITDQAVHLGIGNVAGRVCTGTGNLHLVSQPGSLGTELPVPTARPTAYPWPPGAVLLLCSDGIDTRWDPAARPGLLHRHPTVIAAVVHRDHARNTDDAAILVVRDVRDTRPAGGDR